MRLHRHIGLLGFCAIYAYSAIAQAGNGYYSDATEGYYWYKDPAEEAQEEVPKPRKQASRQKEPEQKKKKLPDMADYTYEQLWNMHPDEFKPLLDEFQKKAVMTLQPEDVTAYKTMQDISRRKAVAYMNVDRVITQQNPELSLEHDAPMLPTSRMAENRVAKQDIDSVLENSRERYGLIVFNSEGCPYCEQQKSVLRSYQMFHKWDVKHVDIAQAPGAAEMFNVEITPTIILVKKGSKDFFPISSGVIALDQLKDRVYGGVKSLAGDTTIQQYGVKDYQIGGGLDPTAPLEKRRKRRIKNAQ